MMTHEEYQKLMHADTVSSAEALPLLPTEVLTDYNRCRSELAKLQQRFIQRLSEDLRQEYTAICEQYDQLDALESGAMYLKGMLDARKESVVIE